MTRARIVGLFGGLLCAMLAFGPAATMDPSRGLHAQTGTQHSGLRVDVDLVLVHATVTDLANKYVNGLTQKDFRIWEDKIEQPIEYFSSETVPLSIGIIFDISGSMENKLMPARSAAGTFLRLGDQDDEYFLIQFSDSPRVVQDFTTDITSLQSRLLMTGAKGQTSLYDAMYLGLDKVNHGTNARKALLLITDGQDNHSRYSFQDVKRFAKEHDVMIYAIGIEDDNDVSLGFSSRYILENLAELTGGAAFFPRSVDALSSICRQIGAELKNQYVLGYRSQNLSSDGKWRKIRVQINRPKGMSLLSVRARNGYYASNVARAMK